MRFILSRDVNYSGFSRIGAQGGIMEYVQTDNQQGQVECATALWTAKQWKQYMDNTSRNG